MNMDMNMNINMNQRNFNNDIDLLYKINPLIMFYNFESYEKYDKSKKILAPKQLLNNLANYSNMVYPIHLKIKEQIFTVMDFIDDIDCLFIPTEYFYKLGIEENKFSDVTIIKNIPEKATFLKIKPESREFYDITDIKQYLERNLTNYHLTVQKDEILDFSFFDKSIKIRISECLPNDIVSINEIEELEIDFEPLEEESKQEEETIIENEVPPKIFGLNITYNKIPIIQHMAEVLRKKYNPETGFEIPGKKLKS